MFRRIALGLVVGTLSAATVFAQTPPAQLRPRSPRRRRRPAPTARAFAVGRRHGAELHQARQDRRLRSGRSRS